MQEKWLTKAQKNATYFVLILCLIAFIGFLWKGSLYSETTSIILDLSRLEMLPQNKVFDSTHVHFTYHDSAYVYLLDKEPFIPALGFQNPLGSLLTYFMFDVVSLSILCFMACILISQYTILTPSTHRKTFFLYGIYLFLNALYFSRRLLLYSYSEWGITYALTENDVLSEMFLTIAIFSTYLSFIYQFLGKSMLRNRFCKWLEIEIILFFLFALIDLVNGYIHVDYASHWIIIHQIGFILFSFTSILFILLDGKTSAAIFVIIGSCLLFLGSSLTFVMGLDPDVSHQLRLQNHPPYEDFYVRIALLLEMICFIIGLRFLQKRTY